MELIHHGELSREKERNLRSKLEISKAMKMETAWHSETLVSYP
jgi:hypothetical protein